MDPVDLREDFLTAGDKEAFNTGLPEIRKVARMLKKHLENLLTYFDCYITNAASEGLNSLLRETGALTIKIYVEAVYPANRVIQSENIRSKDFCNTN